MTHPRLHDAFLAGVRWVEEERTFVVQLGHFRGWLDVEDTAYFVTAYDEATGEIDLSDRTREDLVASALSIDADGVLRCVLRRGFAARFMRGAQAQLLEAVELDGSDVVVRVANARLRAPALDALS